VSVWCLNSGDRVLFERLVFKQWWKILCERLVIKQWGQGSV